MQLNPMIFHEAQEVIGEPGFSFRLHLIEHLFDVLTDSRRWHTGFYPVIHTKSRQLTLKDRHGIQKYPWSLHLALHHLQRLLEEELIVRVTLGNRDIQGVAILTTCPTYALQVVGLSRRHRTEQDRGQVAHINPHLQGWCGREQIDMPRLMAFVERLLGGFAHLSR